MNGFIVIDRNIEDWRWWGNPTAMGIWLLILVKANWKDGFFQGEPIPRGSFATSLPNLAMEIGLSESTVRRWLKRFEEDGQIEQKVTNRYRVIKVLNYAKYQDIPDDRVNSQMTGQATGLVTGLVTGQMTPNRTNKQSNKETNIDTYTAEAKLVIDYFNRKTGKALKYTEGNMRHIRQRMREGFKLSDFEKVIDRKYKEWHGSPKMQKFLRPETLFGSKFDSYLNEDDASDGSTGVRIDTPDWYKRVQSEGLPAEEKADAALIEEFERMKRSMNK